MTKKERTLDLLRHLTTRPGHDEVKADFRQILIGEFDAELDALDFERRACLRSGPARCVDRPNHL